MPSSWERREKKNKKGEDNIAFKDLNNVYPNILKQHFEEVGIKHKATEKKLILDFSVFKNAPKKKVRSLFGLFLIFRVQSVDNNHTFQKTGSEDQNEDKKQDEEYVLIKVSTYLVF